MGKPRLIILIRHGQSEGNKNRDIHQTIPDHRVKLTPEGWQQAYDAGRRLRQILRPEDTLHFFTSPYRRTRETTEGILGTLTNDDPEPSPFRRSKIKVYEEPRLREQDFGNFQPCSAEMERMWQERADYGHFFYRIPNGESAADAYDRISGFNESLWRQFGDDDFASVCVLVTHGLMSRVFLMKWYHFSVEYFEDLRNIRHCEFLTMRRHEDGGKYILETKMRTWSELRRERALQSAREKEGAEGLVRENGFNGVDAQTDSDDGTASSGRVSGDGSLRDGDSTMDSASCSPLARRRPAAKRFQPETSVPEDSQVESAGGPQIDVTSARDEMVSSPDGTPSFISFEDRMRSQLKSPKGPKGPPPQPLPALSAQPQIHIGRDFGGTYSGHSSVVASDADSSDDGETPQRTMRVKIKPGTNPPSDAAAKDGRQGTPQHHRERNQSRMGRGTRANRLGDQPHSSDGEHEADSEHDDHKEDGDAAEGESGGDILELSNEELTHVTTRELKEAKKEDRSLKGTVY
ncbi:hypothetical protein P8C59_005207 [Phyllachora maydis]|uniref:Phosphoglycerate mutase family domain protein n=1 Tax=Phyllachora maydis TaxID=1825666 RepID=A0AAD9I3Z0_9PEZI|nr:hypothetical protein P8C59_005207 [Phyllachora maydis]